MVKVLPAGSVGSENLLLADATPDNAALPVPTFIVPNAPAGRLVGPAETSPGQRLTPAARFGAMARAIPLETPFPAIPTAGAGLVDARQQRITDYFYQRRQTFVQSLLLARPELREHPQAVIDLADQWVARNVVRGMSGNRAGIAAVNARGMLIAIDARIRELEAAGQAVPADLLAARQAAAQTVDEVRTQLRAKGFGDDEINRYLGLVGPRINTSTQGWERHVTELRARSDYKAVQIPPAAAEGPVRQGVVVPTEHPVHETVRFTFLPGLEGDHSAQVRADRDAGNAVAVAHANERIALARVVASARLRQDLAIGGPLSSLV